MTDLLASYCGQNIKILATAGLKGKCGIYLRDVLLEDTGEYLADQLFAEYNKELTDHCLRNGDVIFFTATVYKRKAQKKDKGIKNFTNSVELFSDYSIKNIQNVCTYSEVLENDELLSSLKAQRKALVRSKSEFSLGYFESSYLIDWMNMKMNGMAVDSLLYVDDDGMLSADLSNRCHRIPILYAIIDTLKSGKWNFRYFKDTYMRADKFRLQRKSAIDINYRLADEFTKREYAEFQMESISLKIEDTGERIISAENKCQRTKHINWFGHKR